MAITLHSLYSTLLKHYGPQGWWPVISHSGTNPTKTGSVSGYHPKDYSFPRSEDEKFEIIIGAILTQNTNWTNVEKALLNLQKIGGLSPLGFAQLSKERVSTAIRPAGYFNQKTEYLFSIHKFFLSLSGRTPTRDELLSVKGVGKETADSILLYAYHVPTFVIDAYTKRILLHLGIISEGVSYDTIQDLFHSSLKKDYQLFQEFHALLVEHAKRYYQKKPYQDSLLNEKI